MSNAVPGDFAYLLRYALIVLLAAFTFWFFYGYLGQLYVFRIYLVNVTGAVFVGV